MRAFTGHEATDPLTLARNDNLVVPQSYTFVRAQQSAKAAELQTTLAKNHKDVGQASTRLRQRRLQHITRKVTCEKLISELETTSLWQCRGKIGATRSWLHGEAQDELSVNDFGFIGSWGLE
jgi:hypothetical protein